MRDKKMKVGKHIIILTTLLLTLTIGRSQTNVYHPFPDTSVVWTESFGDNPCYCPPTACMYDCGYYYKYFMNGDTLHNGHSYHKIYSMTSRFQFNGTFFVGSGFSMGLRQDTIAKRIYMFDSNYNDTLLYDFNLHVGDTLPSTFVNDNSSSYKNYVSSIDSILFGTSYRKLFHISSVNPSDSNYIQLIEGIGSTGGVTFHIAPPFETSHALICFSQNNITLYSNPNSWDCYYDLSINETKNNSSLNFSLYPNPFSYSTNLNANIVDLTVTIYNLCGQPVKQIKTNSKQTVLNRDNLPSGLYFLRVTKDNKTVASDKLIIVDN